MKADPLLSKLLGVDLCPGTINIKVNGDHFLFTQAIRPGDVSRVGCLRTLACTVSGLNAFILCTWPEAPPRLETVFEIVAGLNLRDAIGLSDGSPADIDFDPSQVREHHVK
jgi:CTP-dependent riboflavin kinase